MSRRTTWLARLLSVATGPLILGGCATQTVVFDPATGPGGVGRPPAEEVPTDCAREVYDAYEARVREVARGPLRFLAEIHGNNHRDAAGRIEIATVGVDRELAFRLRALLELIRDAHLQGVAQAPRLDVLIEPADTLHYTASGAKHCGILKSTGRGLHIELPKAA